MVSVREIRIEPLTEARFRPFGQIVAARRSAPSYRSGGGSVGWLLDFQTSGRTRLSVSRTPFHGLRFRTLERHFHVTQTFIHLEGPPAVLAVAPPGGGASGPAPEPDTVHAFLLDGTRGVLLSRGTWHSPARYPLRPPATVFAVISDHETASDPTLSQEVDYHERYGLTFRLTPGSAMSRRPLRRRTQPPGGLR